MPYRSILLAVFTFLSGIAYSQDSLKTTTIAYADIALNLPLTNGGGLQANFTANYQVNHSLFSLRAVVTERLSLTVLPISPTTVIPLIHNNGSETEYALLYGWRIINGGHSYSLSLGASTNQRTAYRYDNNNNQQQVNSSYAGLPFELNVLWFKAQKRRYRIYGLIPVGKPTGFGGSVGLKFNGAVSKYSYASLGFVYGLGYFKRY